MTKEILKDGILNEEQLDGVAGGTFEENGRDTEFLRDIGFDIPKGPAPWLEVDRAWAKSGISVMSVESAGTKNIYYYKGKEIPRAQALEIAMKKAHKKIDLRPYYVG